MKKFLAKLCALVVISTLVLTMIGCENNSDSFTYENTYFLAKTEVLQAKDSDNNSDEISAEYIETLNNGDLDFYIYNIGMIKSCFIQTLTQPIYNDNGLKKIEYKTGMVTTDSVSKGLSKSVSTSQTVSVSNSIGNAFSWKFGTGTSSTLGINVGIGNIASFSSSNTINTTTEIANSTQYTTSNSVAESVVNKTNESTDVQRIVENKQEITYEYDMADYEIGYYYALSLVADIDIYQIIVINSKTNKFYTTYFISNLGDNNTAIRMLSADSPSFIITPEYQLSPITEIEIDDKIESVPNPEPKPDDLIFVEQSIAFKKESCKLDNGFDPRESGTDIDIAAHSIFDLFELRLNNCATNSNGVYFVANGKEPELTLKLLQNPSKLPTGKPFNTVNWTIHYVSDDNYNQAVYGTNISNKTIGLGAYYIKVSYTDGSANEFNKVNFLNGASKGNLISLDFELESGKILKSIDIVFVYELYYDYMSHIFNWGGTKCYANWRCSATVQFGAL